MRRITEIYNNLNYMRNYYVISILLFFIISYLSIYNKCYWLNRYCFNQRVKSNLFKYSILSQALL